MAALNPTELLEFLLLTPHALKTNYTTSCMYSCSETKTKHFSLLSDSQEHGTVGETTVYHMHLVESTGLVGRFYSACDPKMPLR